MTADARRTIPGLRRVRRRRRTSRAVARSAARRRSSSCCGMFPDGRAAQADERDPVPVRALRRRGARAADPRGEAPPARSPRRARGVPRARGRRAETPSRSRARPGAQSRRLCGRRRPPDVGRPRRRAVRGRRAAPRARAGSWTTSQPVPHAWHAAIVRSQLAHARVAVDPSAALEAPGVVRRADGRRRRAAVEAVPRGDRLAGRRTTPPPWRPPATWASRSPSSSPATATSPRTRPSSSRSSTTRSSRWST